MTARDEIFRIAGLNDQSSRYFEMRDALDAYAHEIYSATPCACGNPDGPHIPGVDSMVCIPECP